MAAAMMFQAAVAAEEEPDVVLDKMTVTTTRNPLPAFDAPGMVTVLDREDIQEFQPSTPDDLLRFVPGVEFVGGPRRTGEVPSIRGFDGADVVIMFDGARQNLGAAHDGRFFIDPELLRGVEVLRGASSALYGNGGAGGVLEFRTARASDFLEPGESYGGRLALGYQDVNTEDFYSLTAYGRDADTFDLILNLTYRDSDDIALGGGGKLENTSDSVIAGMIKAGFAIHEDHYVELSHVAFTNDAEEPNVGQSADDDDAVDKDISSHTFRIAYDYDNPDDRLLNLDVVAYYTAMSIDEQRLDDLGAGPAGEVLTRDIDTYGFRIDNRSLVDLGFGQDTRFTYGFEFYRDEQDADKDGAARDGVPVAESDSFGAFLQGEFTLDDLGSVPGELLIVPGARFDYYALDSDVASDGSRKETELSPRIAATYKPVPWLMTFASYAHAFRAPTFDELFLQGVHFQIPLGPGANVTNVFVPNPDLKPQRTRTVEFGGGVQFDDVVAPGDRVQAKGSYFYTYADDFIDQVVDQREDFFIGCNPFIGQCDGTTTTVNVPKAELDGFELEAGYESRRFKVTLGYSTINGEDGTTGDPLGLLAPDQFTAAFGVKIPEIDSFVGWRAIFADDFNDVAADDQANKRDGYDTHDFFAYYAPSDGLLQGFRFDVGVDNAFDEAYSRTFTDANEPGRNFKAKVSYTLNF